MFSTKTILNVILSLGDLKNMLVLYVAYHRHHYVIHCCCNCLGDFWYLVLRNRHQWQGEKVSLPPLQGFLWLLLHLKSKVLKLTFKNFHYWLLTTSSHVTLFFFFIIFVCNILHLEHHTIYVCVPWWVDKKEQKWVTAI